IRNLKEDLNSEDEERIRNLKEESKERIKCLEETISQDIYDVEKNIENNLMLKINEKLDKLQKENKVLSSIIVVINLINFIVMFTK
ncbi:MAG: hypothetical protein MR274_03810, partial [Clostridium sp.]|nr:hypothetical protein [Clostridium sp.]